MHLAFLLDSQLLLLSVDCSDATLGQRLEFRVKQGAAPVLLRAL